MLRPPTVVSAGGFRRPWRPRSVVAWGEVESVVIPTIGLPGVRLQLTSGKVVVLEDIPAEKFEAVAAIGGKPVRRLPVQVLPKPMVSLREPTPMQIEADVERRARLLADERRRMESGQFRPPSAQ